MTTKELVLLAVENLPETATIEDAMEQLLFIAKIERGIEQAGRGETITHDEIRCRVSRWSN